MPTHGEIFEMLFFMLSLCMSCLSVCVGKFLVWKLNTLLLFLSLGPKAIKPRITKENQEEDQEQEEAAA